MKVREHHEREHRKIKSRDQGAFCEIVSSRCAREAVPTKSHQCGCLPKQKLHNDHISEHVLVDGEDHHKGPPLDGEIQAIDDC